MTILVTGGSGSGKSAYAEKVVTELVSATRIYLATMHAFDQESQERIRRHRRMREGKGFETLECPYGLRTLWEELGKKPEGRVILLEDLPNLVANEMFENKAPGRVYDRIWEGLTLLMSSCQDLVIVTNEIFSDGTLYEGEMKEYLDTLGALNCRIAERADQVTEVIYGLPFALKGKPDSVCKLSTSSALTGFGQV